MCVCVRVCVIYCIRVCVCNIFYTCVCVCVCLCVNMWHLAKPLYRMTFDLLRIFYDVIWPTSAPHLTPSVSWKRQYEATDGS